MTNDIRQTNGGYMNKTAISVCIAIALSTNSERTIASGWGDFLRDIPSIARTLEKSTSKTDSADSDPCSKIGQGLGAAIGGLIGYQITKRNDSSLAKVIVPITTATLGGLIGREFDRRRCHLNKIAEEHKNEGLVAEFEDIEDVEMSDESVESASNSWGGENNDLAQTNQRSPQSSKKLKGMISRWGGVSHFESGSDHLTKSATQYFTKIGEQYLVKKSVAAIEAGVRSEGGSITQEGREEIRKSVESIQIVLVGHTDDTGDSALNQNLSERRARTVAKLFESRGVPVGKVYYRGSGETDPIADNSSEEGRAKNRRVEVIELPSDKQLVDYIKSKKTRYEFYRSRSGDDMVAKADDVQDGHDASQSTTQAGIKKASQSGTNNARLPRIEKPDTVTVGAVNKIRASPTVSARKPITQTTQQTQEVQQPTPMLSQQKTATEKIPRPIKQYDFGGQPLETVNAQLNLGKTIREEGGFSLISKVYADDTVVLGSCNRDRPRVSGAIKSLKDDKAIATTEYLNGLYNTSWHDTLNGNLVMLNHVAVLSDSTAPTKPPELKVYAAYNAQNSKTAKPDVLYTPAVNTYRGSKGVLYRVFTKGAGGIQCMDVLLPRNGGFEAKTGKLIYSQQGDLFAADYKPKMIR